MSSQYAMVFYPEDAALAVRSVQYKTQLLSGLTEAGFLGTALSSAALHQPIDYEAYLPGEHFFQFITFMGCSPQLVVTPPENDSEWSQFCHIEIKQYQNPQFLKGLNKLKYTCPKCKSRPGELPDLRQWSAGELSVCCKKCRKLTLVENLNWRHSAAFANFKLIIHSVYPHEAIPAEKFLGHLKQYTDEQWNYFYSEG